MRVLASWTLLAAEALELRERRRVLRELREVVVRRLEHRDERRERLDTVLTSALISSGALALERLQRILRLRRSLLHLRRIAALTESLAPKRLIETLRLSAELLTTRAREVWARPWCQPNRAGVGGVGARGGRLGAGAPGGVPGAWCCRCRHATGGESKDDPTANKRAIGFRSMRSDASCRSCRFCVIRRIGPAEGWCRRRCHRHAQRPA